MDLLRKILGGITLTVIVVVGGCRLLLWWKLRGIARDLAGTFPTPAIVQLAPEAEWMLHERQIIFDDSFHPRAYLEYLTHLVTLNEECEARYRQTLDTGLSLQGLLPRIAADTGYEFSRHSEVGQPRKTEIYGVKFPPN
jgi:hypothetical protein